MTDISGIAELSSTIIEGAIDSLSMNLKLTETALFENDTINLNGNFDYENNNLVFSEPFKITLGERLVLAEGDIDFSNKELDLDLNLTDVDEFVINNFLEIEQLLSSSFK